MVKGSYLNSDSVKNNCREYINYLSAENDKYNELLEMYKVFINSDCIEGQAKEALDNYVSDVVTGITNLIKANEMDIMDANAMIGKVGNEVFVGDVILDGKKKALDDMKYYGDKASECFRKAYQETDNMMIEYWSRQGRNYDDLVRSARELYNFFNEKEKRYDDINAETRSLFLNSTSLRNISDAFLRGYENAHIGLQDDLKEYSANYAAIDIKEQELIETGSISIDEIYELIALQHAKEEDLTPEEVIRKGALEAILLVAAPAAWELYNLNVGEKNDAINNFYDELTAAGFKETTQNKDDMSIEYEAEITNVDEQAEIDMDKNKVINKEVVFIDDGSIDTNVKTMPYFDDTNPSGVATEKITSDLLFRSYESDVTFEQTTVNKNITVESLKLKY